jgi:hypothetical protein
MEQVKQSTLGEPMYIETLLTDSEWSQCKNKYTTYAFDFADVNKFKTNLFKWRFKMGSLLTPQEIKLINTRIDMIKQKVEIV